MAKDVVMPLLGLTMEEGTLISWLKKEGDPVEKGEVLFEVESDKAIQEVEAQVSGLLAKILVEPGTTLPIGTMIAVIAESDEEFDAIRAGILSLGEAFSAPAQIPETAEKSTTSSTPIPPQAKTELLKPSPASSQKRQKVPISPAARRIAQEHNIDLEMIIGTGPGGRITQADVLRAVETGEADQSDYLELTSIRKLTARRMTQSFQTVPHFYLSSELDAKALVAFREERLSHIEAKTGVRLTYSDILIKCVALTLKSHPLLYAMWEDGKIKLNRGININLATDTEQGLTAPVIQNADRLSLAEIARRRYEVVQKAQAGRLSLDDVLDGTFTLTNLGMFEIDIPQAIINPPQAAILATGSIKERVVAWQGGIYVRPTIHVALSVDHRIVDGVTAAKFLQDFQQLIQATDRLVAEVN